MSRLQRLRYHAVVDERTGPQGTSAPPTTFRGDAPAGLEEMDPTSFHSDADAARFYLDALLQQDQRPAMRSVLAPSRPENVPDLAVLDTRDSPVTQTRLVRFEQRHESIPIFGSHASVELTPARELVSVEASFGAVEDAPAVPSLSAAEALDSVAQLTGAALDPQSLPAAGLVYYQDDAESWHLAWLLREVPAGPPTAEQPADGDGVDARANAALRRRHLPGRSPRDIPRVNYLVDAHHGDVLFYYAAAPTISPAAAVPAIPVQLRGQDESGQDHLFWGNSTGSAFVMSDPLRRTQTFDMDFADLSTGPALPDSPISRADANWIDSHRAAVSAHVNAQRVHDFYKGILQRNGIDDSGMTLISVVNCTYEPVGDDREWPNAFWWQHRMWYGQTPDDSGRLLSLARYLDVIAHELTHGVIEFSSNLVYEGESGALNESYADILGVIINNWYRAPERKDVSTWDWEIGPGFGEGGGPLRDLSDPTRTGDPGHYDDRYTGHQDYGGVHINSGINNKAAFLLLTGTDDSGKRNFDVEEAAVLFYLAMTRLPPLANMSDARAMLISVARTFYSGDLENSEKKAAAIAAAYDAVGVDEPS